MRILCCFLSRGHVHLSFQECWTPLRLLLAHAWDQSQASNYASQIRHFLVGPSKLKITQSPPFTGLCCPRHVVFPHPVTVLPLSLSLPFPESECERERERERICQSQGERSRAKSTPRGMDAGDVWNLVPYAGGGAPDKTIFNRMMLRFRPIAPKPVTGGSVSGGPVPDSKSKMLLAGKRAKRKYVRVRRNSGYRRKNNKSSAESEKTDGSENAAVTLQLMPEKTEPVEGSIAGSSWCKNVDLDRTVEKIEIQDNPEPARWKTGSVEGGEMSDRRVVESWVTVESVGDTCMDVGGLGGTDVEKVKNLERDTCPGFISDGVSRVRWVNEAYNRMVSGGTIREGEAPEIMVWLKMKDNVVYSYTAFTCRVRLQYTWQKEKWTKMVPCDVWKLDCGGFAWRLDIKAALSLGL